MNTKVVFAVVGVVVALVVGFALFHNSGKYGATVNYSGSLSSAALYSEIESIVRDVQNTNAPLVGVVSYASSTYTIPTEIGKTGYATSTISSSTPGASALAGILPGDFVQVAVSTTTSNKVYDVTGQVLANDTVTLFWQSTTGTLPTGLVGLNVRVLPNASWKSAAAVITTTSTSN